jgi:hypothetical protein
LLDRDVRLVKDCALDDDPRELLVKQSAHPEINMLLVLRSVFDIEVVVADRERNGLQNENIVLSQLQFLQPVLVSLHRKTEHQEKRERKAERDINRIQNIHG